MAGWGDLLAQALQGEAVSEYKNSPMYQIGGNLNTMTPTWNPDAKNSMRDYLLQAFTAPLVGTAMQNFADARIANEMRPRYVSLINALTPPQVNTEVYPNETTPSPWIKFVESPNWNPRLGMVPLLAATADWEANQLLGAKKSELDYEQKGKEKLEEIKGKTQLSDTALKEGLASISLDEKGTPTIDYSGTGAKGRGKDWISSVPAGERTQWSSTQFVAKEFERQADALAKLAEENDSRLYTLKTKLPWTEEYLRQLQTQLTGYIGTRLLDVGALTADDRKAMNDIVKGSFVSRPSELSKAMRNARTQLLTKVTESALSYRTQYNQGADAWLSGLAQALAGDTAKSGNTREEAPSKEQVTEVEAKALMAANPKKPTETNEQYKNRLRSLAGL